MGQLGSSQIRLKTTDLEMTNQSRSWTWIHWLGGTFHPASTGLTWDIRGSTEPSGPGIEFSHQEKWQNTCGCKRIQCVTIHRVQSMKTNIGIQKKQKRRRRTRRRKREKREERRDMIGFFCGCSKNCPPQSLWFPHADKPSAAGGLGVCKGLR